EATGDFQWIHVDVERAKAGPFGGPIAHGYLTLSVAPTLMKDIFEVSNVSMAVNYGLNKVRFPSPVPVGSKLRVGAQLASVDVVVVRTVRRRRAQVRACLHECNGEVAVDVGVQAGDRELDAGDAVRRPLPEQWRPRPGDAALIVDGRPHGVEIEVGEHDVEGR